MIYQCISRYIIKRGWGHHCVLFLSTVNNSEASSIGMIVGIVVAVVIVIVVVIIVIVVVYRRKTRTKSLR